MNKIKHNCIIPSAAFTIPKTKIKYYDKVAKKPEVGDLIYGEVTYVGAHNTLESKAARIHTINDSTKAIFVFGNRYAPDYFEGVVPDTFEDELDLLARGGVVGKMLCKNALKGDPTKIKFLGFACDNDSKVLNTRDFQLIKPKTTAKKLKRAKMILCVGTAMNSGKSHAAAACCHALSSSGKNVRAAKITGTASLKDIMLMEDCGASHIADFTYLGYPSTYLLSENALVDIFNKLDLKYGNNPDNYWVVEIADGLLQRETSILLQSEEIRSRVHKLLFCAYDAFGVISGLDLLQSKFKLNVDAISGVCSSSPLIIRELQEFTDLPIINSINMDVKKIYSIIK